MRNSKKGTEIERSENGKSTIPITCEDATLNGLSKSEIIYINSQKNDLIKIDDEILDKLHDANLMCQLWRDYFKHYYSNQNLQEEISNLKNDYNRISRKKLNYDLIFEENIELGMIIDKLKSEIKELKKEIECLKKNNQSNKEIVKSKFDGGKIPAIDKDTQKIIFLRYKNGEDIKKIAEKEKVSEKTVRKYINRQLEED